MCISRELQASEEERKKLEKVDKNVKAADAATKQKASDFRPTSGLSVHGKLPDSSKWPPTLATEPPLYRTIEAGFKDNRELRAVDEYLQLNGQFSLVPVSAVENVDFCVTNVHNHAANVFKNV